MGPQLELIDVESHREETVDDLRGSMIGIRETEAVESSVISSTSPAAEEQPPEDWPKEGAQEAVDPAAVIMEVMPENRLIIKMKVNELPVTALVDTGATHSMISRNYVMDNGLEFEALKPLMVQGFGAESEVKIIGKVILTLTAAGFPFRPQAFLMVDVQLGEWPLLLGEDFLVTNKIIVRLAEKKLVKQFDDGSSIDFCQEQPTGEFRAVCHRLPCYAIQETNVPADWSALVCVGTSVDVPVSSLICTQNQDSSFFIDSAGPVGLHVIPGVVSCHEPGIRVLVENCSRQAARLRPGALVCYLTSVLTVSESLSGEACVAVAGEPSGWQEKIQLGDHLTVAQKQSILEMMSGDQRPTVFGTEDELGRLDVQEHHMELLDQTPIYLKPRRFPEHISEEIDRQCRELELADVIEPSRSPWSAPVVPIRKKDGTIRLCIDYRRLNAVTKPDRFPLPNLNDAVFGLSGMKYFSSCDLKQGYYQLPLDAKSREFTAFSTLHGHWQFKVLAFGLRNAPGAFQRAMSQVLSGYSRRNVIVYIDDLLVMTETYDEHLELMKKVLNTLAAYGVKIKLEKCSWFSQEVEYLGHVVGVNGIRKSDSYVEKVKEFPRPVTVKDLRAFLGLVNWQRKFVPNFSVIQQSLSERTGGRGAKKLVWTTEMDRAFQTLKEKVIEEVTLAYPEYGAGAEPLELFVDASGLGAGACLAQKQSGLFRVIAYSSRSFSHTEQQYSTIERELAALRWRVQTFRLFLVGVPFIIHTDHQPLIYLYNMKLIDFRLARTFEDLADFSFQICYTPGKQNVAADALSRLYDPSSVHFTGEDPMVPGRLPAGLCLAHSVPGGGDALLESLCFLRGAVKLEGPKPESPRQLREILVDFMLEHPEELPIALNKQSRKALKLMRLPGQLPAVELLLAFSRVFRCIVLVHYGALVPVVHVSSSAGDMQSLRRVHLQCLSGVHYNPLVETDMYEPQPLLVPCKIPQPPVDGEDEVQLHEQDECEVSAVNKTLREGEWCRMHPKTHLASIMVLIEGELCCALLDSAA